MSDFMHRILLIIIFISLAIDVKAIAFDSYFEDNTLRIDYIFSGNISQQFIAVKQLYRKQKWAGRRARLDEEFLQGNGQLYVYDHASQELIYVHTFSTIFQEWLMTEEAKHLSRAFELSYNVPYPKQSVDVKIVLRNKYGEIATTYTHTVNPKDIQIREIGSYGVDSKYIIQNGDVADCVDLAIVAEGYDASQIDKFYVDCNNAVKALFAEEPFKSMKSKFNVVAVASVSRESNPSVPHDNVWHDTALHSQFDTFYTDRYLTMLDEHNLHNILSGVPFEHIIVLVNTPIYGGGGIFNEWLTFSSDNKRTSKVFVHEFGHAYAGLADEYVEGGFEEYPYPADVEPWEPNITTLKEFSKKWKNMVGKIDGVSVYEGAGYMEKGCYRPVDVCLMRSVQDNDKFCPVCSKAIKDITSFYTSK